MNFRSSVLLLLLSVTVASAEVHLPSIFGTNMVLQRGMAVPVWGTAAPAETVTVSVNGRMQTTVAGTDGKWRVRLEPMNAGGPYTFIVRGRNTVTFTNVMIGEVWICSGQSNMSFELEKASDGAAAIAASANTSLRLFNMKRVLSDTVLNDVQGSWKESSPVSTGDFSAVAYYFGKNLAESLKVPMGLIHVSWGGTAAEGWMPRAVLESDAEFRPIIDRWLKDSLNYPAAMAEFQRTLAQRTEEWLKDSAEAVSVGRALPRKPTAPRGPGHRDTPCGQYNGMLAPIIPFGMRGVIWYQGEGNASRAEQYRRLFPTLITTWRSLWGEGDFPFYFVQLPNLDRQPEPSKSGWAELREAQMMTLSLPNTGMAVTIDVGDPKDLHPTNKRPVGNRLSAIALAKLYKRNVPFEAPVMKDVQFKDATAVVSFDMKGSALTTQHGSTVLGFTIAGSDKRFVPAVAELRNGRITVSSPQVKTPVSVRYAWADNPVCNLYSTNGLPVAPFRSDAWPEVTAGKR